MTCKSWTWIQEHDTIKLPPSVLEHVDDIDREFFQKWLSVSTPRPIIRLGRFPPGDPNGPERQAWHRWINTIPTLRGCWNRRLHGAFALVSTSIEWVEDVLYNIPCEWEIGVDEQGQLFDCVKGGSYRVKFDSAAAVKASKLILDAPFPNDPNDPWQVASMCVWDEMMRTNAEKKRIENAILSALEGRGYYVDTNAPVRAAWNELNEHSR